MRYAYLRVSTAEQDHDSQRHAMAGEKIDREYVDTISGAKTDRPALAQLLADVRKGDEIVVYRLDRLGRSMVHLVNTVLELAERGVTVRSLTENLDTSGPMGRMILAMYSGLAELERENVQERTRAGMAAAKARGAKIGADRETLGELRRRGHVTSAARRREFAESIRWILEPLQAEGRSRRDMARVLNERGVRTLTGTGGWTPRTVAAALQRLEGVGQVS